MNLAQSNFKYLLRVRTLIRHQKIIMTYQKIIMTYQDQT